MKKLFALLVVATLTVTALAQSPQRMSYQAIVRKTSGELIINQSAGMKISILQGSATGTPVYVETHTTTTNANGLATIEIGGGTIVTGTFAAIDWASGTYYIKTETDPTGGTSYSITGTSQILSVPYALYAKTAKTANYNDLTNKPTTLSGYGITDAVSISGTQTISGTTTFKGTTPDMEEALFDVKNKDGQTIFAVYNEGVRIWVADGAKGSKGGFAVGGFDMIQNYLDVNADSVRIYIDSNPATKKAKGGFAVGGYDMTKGTNTNYMNVNTDASGIINPSQNRVLWYPIKNAFLTGKVLIEKPDSVGTNSFSSGFESKAVGNWSQALGYKAIARGEYSTAIGLNAETNNRNSFAFGEGTKAIGGLSTAMGYYTKASGMSSYANGYCTVASGSPSTALGTATLASGNFSTAMGFYSKARGSSTTAMGYDTDAPSYCETVVGAYNTIYVPLGEYEWKPTDRLFVIGNGTGSLRSDALTVLKNGNVGIGTSTPNAKLEVLTSGYDAYAGIGINSSVAGGKLITLNQGTAGKLNFTIPGVVDLVTFDFVNSRVGIGSTAPGYKLTVNGTAWCSSGAWTGSDIRWKENILPLTNVLSEIQELNAISYDLKTDEYPEMGFEKGTQFGLIAQDVEKIYPELVRTDNNGFKSVSYEKLSVVLLEAVKEQQLEIDELKQLVQNLLQK